LVYCQRSGVTSVPVFRRGGLGHDYRRRSRTALDRNAGSLPKAVRQCETGSYIVLSSLDDNGRLLTAASRISPVIIARVERLTVSTPAADSVSANASV